MARPLARWAPVVAWAGCIFFASTGTFSGAHTGAWILPVLEWLFPRAEHHTLELVHAGIRKLGHFTEYLILALLVARALRTNGDWRPRHAVLAVLFATAYAMTDEAHQYFVPGRTAAPTDVLIDATGAAAGQIASIVRRALLR